MRILYLLELAAAYLIYYSGIYWLRRKHLEWKGASVVLVYHRISGKHSRAGEPVNAVSLDRQMGFIRENFIPSTWEEIADFSTPPVGIRALVTFDDAYREIFTEGIPILEKHGIHSIFFIPTDFAFRKEPLEGSRGAEEGADGTTPSAKLRETLEDSTFPSKADLEKAKSSPFVSLGNHTASHSIASSLSAGEFAEEIVRSQHELGERLGERPVYFAFPRGRRTDIHSSSTEILKGAGIEAAFTMIPGLAGRGTDRYMVPRIGVSHVNDMVLFRVKCLGLLAPLVKLKNLMGSK